jgi:hypothetical protein
MTGWIAYEASAARRHDLLAEAARHRLAAQARTARRERAPKARLRPLARLVLQARHA